MLAILYEGNVHTYRVIHTDGRQHSADPNPTWMGESVGHWEGDTLVVDVIAMNDKTWLDTAGHVHSDALHVIERYTRVPTRTRLSTNSRSTIRRRIRSSGARRTRWWRIRTGI
jgi:hypothetical protein